MVAGVCSLWFDPLWPFFFLSAWMLLSCVFFFFLKLCLIQWLAARYQGTLLCLREFCHHPLSHCASGRISPLGVSVLCSWSGVNVMEREGKRGWNGRNQVLVLCFAINGTESEWGSKEEENKSYAVRKLPEKDGKGALYSTVYYREIYCWMDVVSPGILCWVP